MTIKNETRLGPYEIVSVIGAGGMGEVYRARDPRLKREVAIKVLPASFSKPALPLLLLVQRYHRGILQQSSIEFDAANIIRQGQSFIHPMDPS